MELTIRRASESDVEKCLEIAMELREWFNEAGLRTMSSDLRVHETYVAELSNVGIVGFIVLRERSSVMEILWLAVRKEFHGRGIGTRLVKFAEELARTRGCKILMVKTSGSKDYEPYIRTRKFYEKLGFIQLEKIDPYPGWNEPAIIYVKCLC